MAFKCWQMGLHIQQDNIFIVALQRTRGGWSLRRWWCLPLPFVDSSDRADEALLAALAPWRQELPWRHTASFAFPANRTLQKSLPCAAMTLRENEQTQWIASAMSQQLEMKPSMLCFDYHLAEPQGRWSVTAAQQHDVVRFQRLAQRLNLQITAITPDACALRAFLPGLDDPEATLIWRDDAQWLWANRDAWGHCPLDDAPSLSQLGERLDVPGHQLVCCTAHSTEYKTFDPWDAVVQKYPPLPACGDSFAVAIALAMEAQS